MSNKVFTYNLKKILIAVIGWELIFWVIYAVLINALGPLTGTDSQSLIYKYPATLFVLFILVPVSGIYIYNLVRNNKIAENMPERVAQSYLTPVSSANSFLRYFFFRNALVFMIIALAQPVFGKKKGPASTNSLELVICLDVSNSMNTRDISKKSSRLDISKRAIIQLINNLHGERIGICIFANDAYVQLPVTRDYSVAKMFVNEIESDMVSSQGTNINTALNVSMDMFSKDKTAKGIILITDGENHESNPDKTLADIKKLKIQLSVLGIGTKRGGLVPKNGKKPELGYKKTATGKSVQSKINEKFIQKIASKGGGKASISSSEFPNLSALLTQINRMKRTKIDNFEFEIKQERYQIPLFISLVFWFAFLLWSKKHVSTLDKFIPSK